jgi:hypothetical protein
VAHSDLFAPSEDEIRARYRVRVLTGARATAAGVAHGEGELLEWSRVERALSADVGEPEGVRTIVFDLVVEVDGETCAVCRLDADPGEDAAALARAIEAALGEGRCAPSIKSAASEGVPEDWYPDLASFEVDALERVLVGRPPVS